MFSRMAHLRDESKHSFCFAFVGAFVVGFWLLCPGRRDTIAMAIEIFQNVFCHPEPMLLFVKVCRRAEG